MGLYEPDSHRLLYPYANSTFYLYLIKIIETTPDNPRPEAYQQVDQGAGRLKIVNFRNAGLFV